MLAGRCRPGRSRRQCLAATASGRRRSADGPRSSWRHCSRVKLVAILEAPAETFGQAFADRALARARDAHHDQRAGRLSAPTSRRPGSAALSDQPDGLADGSRAIRRELLAVGLPSAELPPAAAVARQELFGFRWPLTAGAIGFEAGGAGLLPGVDEGLDCLPTRSSTLSARWNRLLSPIMQS